jgi:hypothetical protein
LTGAGGLEGCVLGVGQRNLDEYCAPGDGATGTAEACQGATVGGSSVREVDDSVRGRFHQPDRGPLVMFAHHHKDTADGHIVAIVAGGSGVAEFLPNQRSGSRRFPSWTSACAIQARRKLPDLPLPRRSWRSGSTRSGQVNGPRTKLWKIRTRHSERPPRRVFAQLTVGDPSSGDHSQFAIRDLKNTPVSTTCRRAGPTPLGLVQCAVLSHNSPAAPLPSGRSDPTTT